GDTDLAWTRLTPWRTLLATALEKNPGKVRGGAVAAARGNASAELLASWLEATLDVPVERNVSRGPGITSASLTVPGGAITIDRPDGRLATLERPGDRPRRVALQRRSTPELLAEELRRLDPDEIYAETLTAYARHAERASKQRQKKRGRR
ncbi:MAG: glucose-6-phosphate dehydrogenase assembly protein OpcA, partial [Streptosporangiales bacterium]